VNVQVGISICQGWKIVCLKLNLNLRSQLVRHFLSPVEFVQPAIDLDEGYEIGALAHTRLDGVAPGNDELEIKIAHALRERSIILPAGIGRAIPAEL
jgi:hypothetical protein